MSGSAIVGSGGGLVGPCGGLVGGGGADPQPPDTAIPFSRLWGDELDRELGSSDRTRLFTEARRKLAINAGQLDFCDRTECLRVLMGLTLEDSRIEYDLEAAVHNFNRIGKRAVVVRIDLPHGQRRIIDDLERTTVERLDAEEPSWRIAPPSVPKVWYVVRDRGQVRLGLWPAPLVGDATWSALVDCVVHPNECVDDASELFSYQGDPLRSLRARYRAIVHYAAADLEKYRKDPERMKLQMELYETELGKFIVKETPKGLKTLRTSSDYRASISRSRRFRSSGGRW